MAQEFEVFSESIRDKLNTLLPAQNINSIGVELTGSTQIIPIVDLTEVAEGSSLRQDLQKSFSLTSITSTQVQNASVDLITTTGYYRVFGCVSLSSGGNFSFKLSDGTTTKVLVSYSQSAANAAEIPYDFMVFIPAGDKLIGQSNANQAVSNVATRQIADLSGNLVNPT